MGEVVRSLGLEPDLVISSTATRARATAELARITGGWSCRLVLDDALYSASVDATLEVIAQHGGECSRVMVVGHQPTSSMLVRHLTGARIAMRTATIADIEVSLPRWSSINEASGTLVTLLQPRPFLDG